MKPTNFFSTIVILLTLACVQTAQSRSPKPSEPPKWMTRNFLLLGWSTALPAGRSYNETPRPSLTGAVASFRFRVNNAVTVGPSVRFQLLETATQQTRIDRDTSSITLTSWAERRLIQPSIKLHYYLFRKETLLPYFGLDAGALRVDEKKGLSSTDSSSPQWQPGLGIESGIIVLHGRIPFWLNAQFYAASPTRKNDYELFGFLSFGIAVPN